MRKILKFTLFVLMMLMVLDTANAIDLRTSSSRINSCWWANIDRIYYVEWNSYRRFLWDMFWTPKEQFISNNSTSVTIWSSDSNLLSECTNASDWQRFSSLSPWSNEHVLAIWANCTFNRPTDNNNRTLQFVYNVWYYDITEWAGAFVWDWNLAYYRSTTALINQTPQYKAYTNVWFDNLKIHSNECFNVELRYCWDNIVSNWEFCDDWNNIDWDWCSATCEEEWGDWDGDWDWDGDGDWDGDWDGDGDGDWDGDNYCWDGIVQRPNSNLEMEECDFWSEPDWGFCNRDCTYSNFTLPISWLWEITIPNGWRIVFGPNDNVVIWTWMNPYVSYSLWRPYVRNESDYDLYFDQICVVKQSWTTLLWNSVCEDTWEILQSWETIYLSYIPNFVWSEIVAWDFGDNRLVTTIKHDWVRYDDAYFVSILDVRVAQSSVATTWGWTSYLSDTSKISDISKVADNWNLNPDENKNFVWVWVSTWSVSSYSNDIDDAESVETIDWEWDNYSDSLDEVSDVSWTANGSTSLITEFESYNWIENVFILKSKNFVVNTDILSWIDWARTYIIENWDLEINTNISYFDNIAFVVKWWNIKINQSVWSIDGTYITIQKDWIWWNFLWTWGKTTDILIVNWSLYGNINDLISARTYVKQNATNQIDVWTIVSFGSSLFRKTAPLVSTFINEYLSSEKIAQ